MSANSESTGKPVFVAPTQAKRREVRVRLARWATQGKTIALAALGWLRGPCWTWLRHQVREIRREVKRAARPPVKVRAHGRNVLAISTRPEYGSGVLLMPLSGNSGVVGASWSTATHQDGYGVEVWAETASGRDVWPVGRFPDLETAEQAVELIRKPLTGGTWGKWVFRLILLWLALILVRTWMSQPGDAAGIDSAVASPAQVASPGVPTTAALMGLFGGGESPSPEVSSALAAALGGSAAPPSAPESLADDIYNEAMAKAKASMHEQGPPQSPSPDTGLKGFGLSGGQSGAGCDPKLAFKVSP